MPRKIIDEEIIPIAKVREILEKRKKEDELTVVQNQTLEHVRQFNKLGVEETQELIGELLKRVEALDNPTAIEIVNDLFIVVVKIDTV